MALVAAIVLISYIWETHAAAPRRSLAARRVRARVRDGDLRARAGVRAGARSPSTWSRGSPGSTISAGAWSAWWQNQTATWQLPRDGLKGPRWTPRRDLYTPTHPYYSRPWTWLPMLRPVSFYVKERRGTDIRQVLAHRQPAIFWGSVCGRSRTWRSRGGACATGGRGSSWWRSSASTCRGSRCAGHSSSSTCCRARRSWSWPSRTCPGRSDARDARRAGHGDRRRRDNPETGSAGDQRGVRLPAVRRGCSWRRPWSCSGWFWPVLTGGTDHGHRVARAIVWFKAWI